MKVWFVDNGSDISRSAESAVSIGCSKEHVHVAREALGGLPSTETIYSWRRIRDEGPKPKYEQLFALAPDSIANLLDVYHSLRSKMGAYICRKGDKPKLNLLSTDPRVIDVVHYDGNYAELLAWRYRISCCLGIDPGTEQLKAVDRPGHPEHGSLAASCIKYHPASETTVLFGARTGILKNKGPEHFQSFVRSCVNDTTVLTPGIADIDQSCRIVRRAIRAAVDELLSDTHVREFAKLL